MKSHWHIIWLLKQSIIINIQFNCIKSLFFYYLRYPHDIRMKYCGFGCGYGCQNSCGYPRIRMLSSDIPLLDTSSYPWKPPCPGLDISSYDWKPPSPGPDACSHAASNDLECAHTIRVIARKIEWRQEVKDVTAPIERWQFICNWKVFINF